MTGEELYDRYGKDVLGPWGQQDAGVQQAWEQIASGVTEELEKAARQLLGEPPFRTGAYDEGLLCPDCGHALVEGGECCRYCPSCGWAE